MSAVTPPPGAKRTGPISPLEVTVVRPRNQGYLIAARWAVRFLEAWLVMLLLPFVGFPALSYWQSFALLVLANLLFSFSSYLSWTKEGAKS